MSQSGLCSKIDLATKNGSENIIVECHREFFIFISSTRSFSSIIINSTKIYKLNFQKSLRKVRNCVR